MIPSKADFAAKMLDLARGYVGISRATDEPQIAKFLALFGLPFADGGTPVPFCASGLAWCACKAWADLTAIPYSADNAVQVFQACLEPVTHFCYTPDPSCSAMVDAAIARGNWLPADSIGTDQAILPGWLILYDFGGGDHHVEIVAADNGDEIDTVGFNTTFEGHSGVVASKQRNWSCIWGFVRTWEESE